MIVFKQGNIFDSDCQTLVNTVNCDGVMGKGLALQFKHRYPEMFNEYRLACKRGQIKDGGDLWFWNYIDLYKPRKILCFATKQHWMYPSKLEWIERGKKIQQETVGKNTLEYEHTLELIASCNRALGKFDEAKAELNEALGVLRNLLPDNHPDILRVLTLIANIESHTSASVAMQYAKEATYGLRDVVKKTFSQLGSVERNMFWQQYSRWFQMDLPFLASICEGETSACTAYDGILLSKGLLLNTETEMNHLIAESNDEELLNKYYKLFTTRSRLNKLKDADTQTIDSLEHVIETTEKVLLQKCKAYWDYTKNLSITWQDVKTHLNPEDVAIEFVEVHDQKEGTSKYAALVIRKEDQSPKWVSLFSEKELFTAKSAGYYKSTKLSRLLWEPLNIYIQNKKKGGVRKMRSFFIDLENVRSYGLEGILLLKPEDKVYVFYSDNANTLTIPTIESLNESSAQVKYIKTNYIGANAMDFQIVTLLGASIEKEQNGRFYIISHDNTWQTKFLWIPFKLS